jgi:hypothetical protein
MAAKLQTVEIIDALVKSRILDSKKVQDTVSQITSNAAYIRVRGIPMDAAQRRYWTFCKAIKFGPQD